MDEIDFWERSMIVRRCCCPHFPCHGELESATARTGTIIMPLSGYKRVRTLGIVREKKKK